MKNKAKALIASSLLLGGLAFGLAPDSHNTADAQPVLVAKESSEREKDIQRELGTFAELAKELKPSVVNIAVTKRGPSVGSRFRMPEEFRNSLPEEFWPEMRGPRQREVRGQGSGVIISSDGEILTNNHVVEGATEITVTLSDGRELEAQIVGTDSNTDLALLKLENAQDLPIARLGNSEDLEVGEWVMAIGNPFGLEATVTVGVLSGKGRVIGAGPYDDFLQTDTSINPGNSGGPLFNLAGEVVGINTAIIRHGQGIGFSIPVNMAKEISQRLRTDGRVQRGFLGVGTQALTPALKRALALPADTKGALVSYVIPEGPAEMAGLQVSDIITEVDGRRVTDTRSLLKEVAKLPTGQTMDVKVLRKGRYRTIGVKIAERPDEGVSLSEPTRSQPSAEKARVGVAVRDSRDGGVLVEQVMPNSPAAESGLRRGDKILAVGSVEVQSAREFTKAVENAQGEELALLVERRGRTSYVLIED